MLELKKKRLKLAKFIPARKIASVHHTFCLWIGCTINDFQWIEIFSDYRITLKSASRRGSMAIPKFFRAWFVTPCKLGAIFFLHTWSTSWSFASEKSLSTSGWGATGSGAHRQDIGGVKANAIGRTNLSARRSTDTHRDYLDAMA